MKHVKSFRRAFIIVLFLASQFFFVSWLFLSAAPAKAVGSWSTHLVISEFANRGPNGFNDEFVEIYNPTGSPISIAGWKIQYKSATGTTWSNRASITSGTVPAFGFFLITSNTTDYSGPTTPDGPLPGTSVLGFADDGHIRLVDASLAEVDRVGYGATADSPEGGMPGAPNQGGVAAKSVERKPGGTVPPDSVSGNGQDTNINRDDFILRDLREPQNRFSPIEAPADPMNIYVNYSNTGSENGTLAYPFNTISEGVAASSAGGTVRIAAGSYDEQVIVDKPLALEGAGDTTLIKPASGDKLPQNAGILWFGGTKNVAGVIMADGISGVTIKNLKIDGDNLTSVPSGADWLTGILYRETSGLIDNVTSVNMTIDETGTGFRGYGFYAYSAGAANAVEIKNSDISNYDKNGINLQGATLTANAHDNIVIGRGPLPEGDEVQNGILVIDDAVGTINNNTISNNAYAPAAWGATGLVFYDAGGSAQGNTLTNNQTGAGAQVNKPGSQTVNFSGNTINASGLSVPGISGIYASTFNASAILNVAIDSNQLTGGPGDGIAIGDIPANGPDGSVIAIITNNTISNWQEGIHLYSTVGAGTTITGNTITGNNSPASGIHINLEADATAAVAHNNEITGNLGYGVYNGNLGLFNAENNWWGSNDGPFVPNNTIFGNVDFTPWTEKDFTPPTISAFDVVPLDINAGGVVTITATVADLPPPVSPSGVAAVSADFAFDEAFTSLPGPSSVAMSHTAGDNYVLNFTVPTSWGTKIYLKVAARDNAGNYIRSTETKNFVVHPHTWNVDDDKFQCPEADFTGIQEAIISPRVWAGDTIIVCDGSYNENVAISGVKPVNVKSLNGADVTTIDGIGLSGHGVTLQNLTNYEFSGFSIQNFSDANAAGISISGSQALKIRLNKIHHNRIGIVLQNSDQNNINHNKISEIHWTDSANWLEGDGIVIWDTNSAQASDKNTIIYNEVFNVDRIGILVATNGSFVGQNKEVSRNKVTAAGYEGIDVSNNSKIEVSRNEVAQTTGYYGILISAFGGASVSGLKVERNKVSGSASHGVYLTAYSGGVLQKNQVNKNETDSNVGNGLLIENSSGNTVEDNRAKSNGQSGILLVGVSQNRVNKNNLEKNGLYGIGLTGSSSKNSFEKNNAKNNAVFDFFWDSTGTGNTSKKNIFKTSSPAGWWK